MILQQFHLSRNLLIRNHQMILSLLRRQTHLQNDGYDNVLKNDILKETEHGIIIKNVGKTFENTGQATLKI